ncbi:acetyl-CoA synthetase-like protein [Neocallimastix californiae]|uniref:Acetyl-CoA synthetase-like protein n=1 Tax=Neocallimastix californiae TaxID=1754190 RepID=A0A1Y2ACF0_9FUNG|nr:acetyl-CoA synthetase-like protein [Neocallimastix californiae]|eukprot:ORY20249.1 acetyl-CoA synthetase-like protein [Neocallimastix californiae]
MKVGGTFLPVDLEYPEERIKYMIEEVGAKVVLKYITNGENNKKLNHIENLVKSVLAITNFSFDIHVNELMLSLILELSIVLVDENKCQNVSLLSSIIDSNNVNLINTTPSRIKIFLEYEEFRKKLNKIKVIILAGEALPMDLCKIIHRYSQCKIYNGYGPIECYYCTYKEINEEKENKITIGSPICNCKLYILDKYRKPVLVGVAGEI